MVATASRNLSPLISFTSVTLGALLFA